MAAQELIITFEWDGKTVHKETSNFEGKDCEDVTQFIEDALGAVNEKRTYKSEFFRKGDKLKDKPRLRA